MKTLLCLLALLVLSPGCAYLRCEAVEQSSTTEAVEVGREVERFATLAFQETPERLVLEAGEITKVRYDDVRRGERGRSWDVEFFSISLAAFDEFGGAGILLLPVTLVIDFGGPVVILFVTPVQAIFKDTDPTESHTARVETERTLWKSCLLRDPKTGAELSFDSGTVALHPEELALNGFSSETLEVRRSAKDEALKVTVPAPALAIMRSSQEALAGVPASRRVTLLPGGDLHATVRAARPGTWIQLEAGVYELRYGLSLGTKDLTIAGRGAGRTRLTSTSATGLSVWGGPVTLRGLHVALKSPEGRLSTGVENSGTLRMLACEISGARGKKLTAPPKEPGGKETTSYRAGIGVSGTGRGKTTLEGCLIRDNFTAAVLARGDHSLFLSGCQTKGGELEVISVRDRAQAKIERTSSSAGSRGLLAMGEARLEVSDSNFQGTGLGISLTGTLWVRLKNVTCRESQAGILIETEPKADVEVKLSSCYSNREHGISVQGSSAPRLIDNRCHGNGSVGIFFDDQAKGLAKGNTCYENKTGVGVQGRSAPRIESNDLNYNKGSGLMVGEEAQPTLTGNTSKLNRDGLYVGGTARPVVTGNTFRDCHQAGVVYEERSAGTLSGNTITGNKVVGILLSATASPVEDGNTLSGNAKDRFVAPR